MRWSRLWDMDAGTKRSEAAAMRGLAWGMPIAGLFMSVLWLAVSMHTHGTFAWQPFLSLAALGLVMCGLGFGFGVGVAWFIRLRHRWLWLFVVAATIAWPVFAVAFGAVLPWDWATRSMTVDADKAIHAAQMAWMWGLVFGGIWQFRADFVKLQIGAGLVSADPPQEPSIR